MSRVRITVVGAGNWGRNHVRTLVSMADVELAAICDTDSERRAELARQYQSVLVTDSLDQALDGVDGVVVSTPVISHAQVAREALRRGLPALIEKPMALSVDEAEDLFGQARALLLSVLDAEHPRLADVSFELGTIERVRGRLPQAEVHFTHALSIDEKRRGPWHPYVAITLGELAEIYRAQERYALAKDAYRRALEIDERVYGAEHSYVLDRISPLAELHAKLQERAAAIQRPRVPSRRAKQMRPWRPQGAGRSKRRS